MKSYNQRDLIAPLLSIASASYCSVSPATLSAPRSAASVLGALLRLRLRFFLGLTSTSVSSGAFLITRSPTVIFTFSPYATGGSFTTSS